MRRLFAALVAAGVYSDLPGSSGMGALIVGLAVIAAIGSARKEDT